jgi:sulfur transfer protein SufE
MERVPGCLATLHLQTTLITSTATSDATSSKSPENYRVSIAGSSDAMLSGGLLAILANVLSGEDVTAADVLQLDSTVLTNAMGMQSVLSRGRNDGMASMVRVVQNQIRSLLSIDPSAEPLTPSTDRQTHNIGTTTNTGPRVAMLLSGGVDSSVALHLLQRQNYNLTAFYLRIWLEDELAHLGECPWEDDLKVCQAVCEHAGNVPLQTVSLGKEYRERVVQYTIEEARRGRTPNPDIMCNSRVKFGCFLEYIETSGMEFDYVASGHYARLEEDAIATTHIQKRLFRAPDPIKDQSYFLCALTQQQ